MINPIWIDRIVPDGFWKKKTNRRAYMDWLGQRMGFKKTSDWYRVTKLDFDRSGGGGLLANYYHASPHAALREYKPGYEWKEWLARSCPQGFWQEKENRLRYLKWLGAQLGFKAPEDWYGLKQKSFFANHGGTLLHAYYGGSIIAAVREYMPDYEWKEWCFCATPQGFWKKRANRRRYMDWLGVQLKFKTPRDWANLTKAHFKAHHGAGMLATHFSDSPARALKEYMPGYDWKKLCRDAFETRRRKMWTRRRRKKARSED